MPQPTIKQNASRIFGVTRPSQAITASAVAPISEIDSDTSATMRRSYMSAMAPAGIEISMIGSIRAVCTSATLSADERHLRHRPGGADALDQQAEIGQQAGQPDAPEYRMPQRRGNAVGGKYRSFRHFGHDGSMVPVMAGL